MHLPSALEARESILCLYRSKTERMHAAVHFLLSGLERDERLLTILDARSEAGIRALLSHLGAGSDPTRYRRLAAESFVEQAPLDAETAVELIRRSASGWRGRPSLRPVRIVVDLHYLLVSLGTDRDVPALSRQLAALAANLPVILLCLLFVEQLPCRGLGTLIRSFSRITASEALRSRPSTGAAGRLRDHSGELDAVLNRLVLSDETVLAHTIAGVGARRADADARAFLHVAADGILILSRELVVEYASPSFVARFRDGRRCLRGTPLAACLSVHSYREAEGVFRKLGADRIAAHAPVFAIIPLTFIGSESDRVFEASVTPLLAYGRNRGFVCVLRDVAAHRTDRDGPDGERGAVVAEPSADTRRARGRARSAGGITRSASYGARAWRQLPRRIIAGRSVTTREVEILELTLNGSTAKQIAEHLGIAPVTVKKHRSNGYRKLGIHDRFELTTLADTGS
ncbi:MAG: LuxR C-terminal-related transcriptional regulator [Spirochaetaceae bacterium]